MTDPVDRDKQGAKTPRVVTAVFGAFLILLAIGILLWVEQSMIVGAVIAASAVGWLGVDACVSAARNKPSLLERIGPLP
jgi:hypothetical protein